MGTNNIFLKIRLIFLPYFLFSVSYLLGFSLFVWLISMKFQFFIWKNSYIDLLLMIALPIFFYFFMKSRLKLLYIKVNKPFTKEIDRDRGRILIWVILYLSIFISMINLQKFSYLIAGKLTVLKTIEEINNFVPSRYYSLENKYVNNFENTEQLEKYTSNVSKNTSHYFINLFTVFPLFSFPSDSIHTHCNTWLGFQDVSEMDASLGEDEKQDRENNLISLSHADFQRKNLLQFNYLERIEEDWELENYKSAIKKNQHYCADKIIVLKPISASFENRTDDLLQNAILTYGIICFISFFVIITTKIDECELVKYFKAKNLQQS